MVFNYSFHINQISHIKDDSLDTIEKFTDDLEILIRLEVKENIVWQYQWTKKLHCLIYFSFPLSNQIWAGKMMHLS